MIRVGIVFEYATLNGGEQSMLAVLAQLANDSRFQFTAFAPDTGPLAHRLTQNRITHVPFCVRDESGAKQPPDMLVPRLGDAVGHWTPQLDVLHANSLSMSRLTGKLGEVPFVRTGHLRDIIGLRRGVIRDLNSNDALVAVSAATRQFHIDQGLSDRVCQVIYNGVDTARFHRIVERDVRTAVFPNVPADAQIVLNVGQICLRKGQLDLANVIANWTGDRPAPHLALIGERHSTKPESVAYEQAIADAFMATNSSHRLHLPGFRNDIETYMNAADLLVHTARQEPLGRVLLEAAACELPIVATNVGGTPEILTDRVHGWLIPANDNNVLRTTVAEALDNESTRRAMAEEARKKIRDSFAIPRAAENLADFWQSVANRRTGQEPVR